MQLADTRPEYGRIAFEGLSNPRFIRAGRREGRPPRAYPAAFLRRHSRGETPKAPLKAREKCSWLG